MIQAAKLVAESTKYEGRVAQLFPDKGPLRRELYQKHLEFFAAGKDHRERCFMAANRVGKTDAGAFEMALHLTGEYPRWWEGRRFNRPVTALVAGDTSQSTRDILQLKLLGEVYDMGTGMIPKRCIGEHISKSGMSGALDTIRIRHKSGRWSKLMLRSYDQGRRIFQGFELDVGWCDEEPPIDVYNEMLIRTATTNGLCYLTFTPLTGLSETVLSFLPKDYVPH